MPAHRPDTAPGSTLALVASVADIALAVGLGMVRILNSPIGQRRAEGILPTVALVVLVAAPGVLGVFGVAIGRPALFAVAGVACLPLAFVSIAAIPLLIVGALYLLAFHRASRQGQVARTWVPLGVVFLIPLLGALVMLVVGTGHYTYTYATGSQEGEAFLPSRAAISLLIIAADIALTAALASQTRKVNR